MSQFSRGRPPGETSGSNQRPARQVAGSSLVFDLDAELDSLKQEASWQHGDRNARTLVQGPGLRLVLTTAKAGARIREHRTSAWVSIEAIDGHLQIHMPEQVMDLPRGHVLVLEPEMPHDVEALKESAFLLTIASTTENKAAT